MGKRNLSRGFERSTEILLGCIVLLVLPVPLVIAAVGVRLLLEQRFMAGLLTVLLSAVLTWFCAAVGLRLLTGRRTADGRLVPVWSLYLGAFFASASAARSGVLFGPEHANRQYEEIGKSLREARGDGQSTRKR